jgi:diguanylate cyclase (GGDEF)-like protein
LGWLFSYIIVASAGLYQAYVAQAYKESNTIPFHNSFIQEGLLRLVSYIPYLWVIGAYHLLVFFHNSSQQINSNLLFIGVGFVILVVIIRQIITLNENKDLLSSLRNALGRVKQQAFELDKNNIILQDEIIERQRIQEQLAYDALHDGLTGLANRVLLMDRLNHAIEVTKREYEFTYSILFLDVDNFKTINDRLGHTVGDSVLFEIGQRLKNCTRSLDTVARYGGDEFVILLEYANEKNTAISVLDRILSDLVRPIFLNGKEVLITCSIGIVQEISEYTNSEDVLRDADFALYRAKEKGKAQYEIFDETMRTLAMTRLEIENDLRRAITNREFILNYQPIFLLDKSTIIGLEALVRWQHPLRGLLMPSEFIPAAEETGLILQLGDWVLHEACTQMKYWHKEFPGLNFLSISVNISGKQINHKGFVDNVKHIIDLTGIDPSKLQLEITETALVENQSLVNDVILDLQKIGVTFMIDDFGIGYSSLKYLQNFSVNTIKIDKSFIKDILDGKKGFELIKSIILMAQGMGIETIAEGIEDDEQLKKLISLNCKFGQGYLMAKPMNSRMVNASLRDQPGNS